MPVGYGKKIRAAYAESRKKASSKYECPSCSRIAVRRKSNGVWECRKCKSRFASGAYEFGR
jgi:large subunit ribosomal protein L37Ae